MKIALGLLLASLVIGQLVRIPLPGQGGGLLVSDMAVVLVLLTAGIQWLKKPNRIGHWDLGFGIFILWSLFTLVIHWSGLGAHNFSIAFLYWLRLTANLLLLPALLFLLRDPRLHRFTQRAFLITIVALVLLGLLQFFLFPNLNIPGFDPHHHRLVSTWLDPNLFGGFLIIIIPWILTRSRLFVLLNALALLLTQSRSSLLALIITGFLFSPFFIRFRLSLLLSLVIFLAGVVLMFPQRVIGLLTWDETASLRLTSLASAWQLVEAHPWLGVGYNAYQFAAAEAGQLHDFTLHSRAGADNTWLTLWVTTGLPGVILFALPWLVVARRLPLAGNFSLVALFIHSQFVNSFLYSHLLITLIIIIALTWKPSTQNSSS